MASKAQSPLWPIAASRVLIGLLWLFSLRWKLPPDFAPKTGRGLLDVPGEWPWSYAMLAMWHGTFLVTGAGRLFGVDGWLRRHTPARSRWRWIT